ncbi:MAG TPA: hypothetical protein VD769_00615 [Gaiellaceae bacterium]|nr:hypothetical protein [Gaiellaceae bacterium]
MRSRRGLALLSLGLVLVALLATPSGAHVSTMQHLWTKHMKPFAVKLFYTKKQSDSRYHTKAAADARYYTKAGSDARYYTTGAADSRFALKGETFDSGLQAYCSRAAASPSSYPGEACGAPLVLTLDTTGVVGDHTSVAVGTDGLPVISYRDATSGDLSADLKILHCGNEACTAGNTATTADSPGGVGTDTSLAIGADGLPVVSYKDTGNLDLKILHCGNVTCTAGNQATSVDTGPANVGSDTSLAIGTDGLPIVSYVDVTNGDLKILHCGDAACTSGNEINVGDSGPVGADTDTSIAIGSDGLPVVSYYDSDDGDLMILHCANATCGAGTATAVDTDWWVGEFSSLAVGTDGFPVVSYRDGTNGDLKVLHCGNEACTAGNVVTPVDTSADPLGYDTSIAIGAEGFPVISYFDGAANDLKVLRCGDAACTSGNETLTLDSPGTVGRHTSIALGADGLPVVSYHDVSNGDLKLARLPVS